MKLFLFLILIIPAVMIVLFLFLIQPRMIHRPSYRALFHVPACDAARRQGAGVTTGADAAETAGGKKILPPLYAHRGLHDNASDAPENSLTAFRKAVEKGYGIELDVQITKDDKLVVFHDDTLERMARPVSQDASAVAEGRAQTFGRVRDYTLRELQQQFSLLETKERIPSFDEVLALVGGKVPLIVEIKEESRDLRVCPIVDQTLASYKGVYCIESFNPLVVRWYKKNRPAVIRGQLSDAFHREKPAQYKGFLYFALTHLLCNVLGRPDFIAYHHRYASNLSRILCRKLFRALSVAWTIKSPEELAKNRDAFDLFIFDSFDPLSEGREG